MFLNMFANSSINTLHKIVPMKINETFPDISKIKTLCCNSEWRRESKLNFRCNKCNKDVTMQMMFAYDALKK